MDSDVQQLGVPFSMEIGFGLRGADGGRSGRVLVGSGS